MRLTLWAGLAGALTLAAVWALPVIDTTGTPFTTHMIRHMLLVAVAAPLLATAIAGQRWDPVRRRPRLFVPMPVAFVQLLAVWAWHVPALHDAAHRSGAVFVLEQVSFLVSGVWLWLAILGGPSVRRVTVALPGLAALALTVGHMTVLGVLLSISPRACYHEGVAALALADQQHGGAVMLAATTAAGLAGARVLGRRLVQAVARTGIEAA